MGSHSKSIYLVSLVLLVGIVSYLLIGKKEEIKNYPSSRTEIVAFGDSLVEGVGASSSDKTFVSLLSQKIKKPIINVGVSGNTTEDGLVRLSQLDKYDIKVLILLLGGNDYLKKVPIDETFGNLSKIIQKAQSKGTIVLLLGVRGGLISDKFDERFEELSEKYKTAYVPDVLDGVFADSRYMSDAVHPNDKGYEIIANRVYPVLQKLLK